MVASSAVSSGSPLAGGKNSFTFIGGSVGVYRGCVGCLNGFSSVSRSFFIMDCTLPTTSTKKPRAMANPTPNTISPILICLAMSVGRRLRRLRKALDRVHDSVDQTGLESSISQSLSIDAIVQISDFNKQRGHRRATQHRQGRCSDRKRPTLNFLDQFLLENRGGSGATLSMRPVTEIPGQEQLVGSRNLRDVLTEPVIDDKNRGCGFHLIGRVPQVQADKQIRLIVIRNSGSRFIIHCNIRIPRQKHCRTEPHDEAGSQAAC